MNIFQRISATLRLREAIKLADKAYAETGKRHYVMPSYGSGGKKLVVMDRFNFRRLKLKHYVNHQARISDLVRESFYFTPYRNGDQYLSESDRKKKAEQYFAWADAELNRKKKLK